MMMVSSTERRSASYVRLGGILRARSVEGGIEDAKGGSTLMARRHASSEREDVMSARSIMNSAPCERG